MQQTTFPHYATHNDVECFDCAKPIGKTEKPIFYGFPRGAYGVYCADCRMRTYYDTDDKSIKFDAKGDPLAQSCECGCIVPRDRWDTSWGWPRCPDCQYI